MSRNGEAAFIFACLVLCVSTSCALKCYRCGKYTSDGAGSVIPCYDYNESHLKECRKGDQFCLKYLNEGIIVRDCVRECKNGIQELSEFFCCQEDGCNGASAVHLAWACWAIAASALLWCW